MIKVLSGTIIVIATLIGIVFSFGVRKGSAVDTNLDVYLSFSREYIYNIVTEVEMYPERKRNLKNIEILEKRGSIIMAWRENYMGGYWRDLRIIEKIYPESFIYEIFDSKSGYTSTISYYLSEEDGFTEISMFEVGNIPTTFNRGLRAISGDDSFLKKEGKWLRVAIQRELIERE
jgi:hypothetical protein